MGTQTVHFQGLDYSFPSDAKDEEILGFLHKNAPSSANGPLAPPPVQFTPPMHQSYLLGDPDKPYGGPEAESRHIRQGVVRGLLDISSPTIAHRVLQQPMTAKGGRVFSPKSRLYPGEAGLKDIAVEGGMAGALGATEGMSSAAESVNGNGVRGVSPSTPTDSEGGAPTSEAAARPFSAAEATPLVTKIPGTRSIARDVAGLAHGLTRSPSGLMDAAQSISSILKKFGAKTEDSDSGAPAAEAPGTPSTTAHSSSLNNPRGFTTTHSLTASADPTAVSAKSSPPHPQASGASGAKWPASSTSEWSSDTATPISASKPKLEHIPGWLKDSTPKPTELKSVAPQVQGKLSQSDIQSMLEKVGDSRKRGNNLIRKNVKGLQRANSD